MPENFNAQGVGVSQTMYNGAPQQHDVWRKSVLVNPCPSDVALASQHRSDEQRQTSIVVGGSKHLTMLLNERVNTWPSYTTPWPVAKMDELQNFKHITTRRGLTKSWKAVGDLRENLGVDSRYESCCMIWFKLATPSRISVS